MSGGDFEKEKWEYERKTRLAERAHDRHHERHDQLNEAAITAGNNALRSLILINGGAAVSMLAFVGAFAGKDKIELSRLSPVAPGLIDFAFGVGLAAAALGAGYFVNLLRSQAAGRSTLNYEYPYIEAGRPSKRCGSGALFLQWVAFVLGVASLVAFFRGTWDVKYFIDTLSKERPAVTRSLLAPESSSPARTP